MYRLCVSAKYKVMTRLGKWLLGVSGALCGCTYETVLMKDKGTRDQL